MGEWLKPAVC